MEITIEFDFIQKDLMGEKKVFNIQNETTLFDFLKSVDTLIEEACNLKGLDSNKQESTLRVQINCSYG